MIKWLLPTIGLIISCVSAQITDVENEDVEVLQARLEEMETHDMQSGEFKSRVRIMPQTDKEKIYYRSWVDHAMWQSGLRIDHSPTTESTKLSKVFVQFKRKKMMFLLGNFELETGQGLLFGNSYGRIISTQSPSAFTRTRQRIGYDLTSYPRAGLAGALLNYESIGLSHSLMLGNSMVGVKRSATGEIAEISAGATDAVSRDIFGYLVQRNTEKSRVGFSLIEEYFAEPVRDKHAKTSAALYFDHRRSYFQINGELAAAGRDVAYTANLTHKDNTLSWVIHHRHYSENFHPRIGSPVADFGDGSNENGWLTGMKYGGSEFSFHTWLGFSNQLVGENGHPRNAESDFMIYVRHKSGRFKSFALRYRRREKLYDQHRTLEGLTQAYWAPIIRDYYSLTYYPGEKDGFTLKCNVLSYRPVIEPNERGILLAAIFPVFSVGKIEAHYGTRIYHTDSWNSRMYDYEYSLPGEFRILPFYETGWTVFSVCRIALNSETSLSFRYAYEWKTAEIEEKNIDFALQVDIHR